VASDESDPDRGDPDRGDPDRGDPGSAVLASVVVQDGQGWWVLLTVGFSDEVVQRRIGPYLTERTALVAADIIRRTADRDAPPPTGF
jgi:hypothetical protein